MKKIIKRLILIIIACCLLGIIAIFCTSIFVVKSTEEKILSLEDTSSIENADCILILGAGIRGDGSPSPMLVDRLDMGIELYNKGVAPKIIMSGDHGRKEYDEVNTMKSYAIEKGVPSEDIFMDHAGFSTYESIYRGRDIFGVKTAVIVSQKYHLYRALFLANALDVNAYGVYAREVSYSGQKYRELREVIAQCKDVIYALVKPKPTYLGEAIPVNGNGNITNDK